MSLLQKSALIVLAFLFVTPVSAQNDDPFGLDGPPTQAATANAPAPYSSTNEGIRAKLEEPYDFIFDECPWSEIHETLQKKLNINIVLTRSATDDGLPEDEPITTNLTQLPAKVGLRLLLEQKNATFVVQDNVLKIISLDDAEDVRYFSTQIFNIRSLLTKVKELEKDRIGKPKSSPRSLFQGASPIVGNPNTDNTNEKGTKNLTEAVISVPAQVVKLDRFLSPDDLISAESLVIDLVQKTITPDSWQETGQGLATLDIIGGCLTITNTQETIDQTTDFLKQLEMTMSK